MNKQEIQKAIYHLTMLRKLDSGEKKSLYDTAISALTQQLNNGWIPTDHRLPEIRRHEGGEPIEFNIMLQGGRVATTGCINDDSVWGWMDWNNFIFNPIGVDVIAWQPLPEPYKEDKNAERNRR